MLMLRITLFILSKVLSGMKIVGLFQERLPTSLRQFAAKCEQFDISTFFFFSAWTFPLLADEMDCLCETFWSRVVTVATVAAKTFGFLGSDRSSRSEQMHHTACSSE